MRIPSPRHLLRNLQLAIHSAIPVFGTAPQRKALPCSMLGREDCTTQGVCPGWGWFNGDELERCDDCAVFANDDAALAHVSECQHCQQQLGADVVAFLVEHQTCRLAAGRQHGCSECGAHE